jgi:hypothetical protein
MGFAHVAGLYHVLAIWASRNESICTRCGAPARNNCRAIGIRHYRSSAAAFMSGFQAMIPIFAFDVFQLSLM